MTPHQYEQSSLTVVLQPIYLCRRLNFALGNVVKYVLRAPYKGDYRGDMEKARYYLKLQADMYLQAGYDTREYITPWDASGAPEFLDAFKDRNEVLDVLFTPEGCTTVDNINKADDCIQRLLSNFEVVRFDETLEQ